VIIENCAPESEPDIENGNIVTEAAIAALKAEKEKTKANAEIELEEAKADVVNFEAGTYGEKATIDPLIDAVAEKEAELAKAEEEYKKELSYLGK
jgi:multidrug resistance efflux pump